MRYILAIFFPFVAFFTIGKPISGIVALLLQCTVVLWWVAMLWAFFAISDYNHKKDIKELLSRY